MENKKIAIISDIHANLEILNTFMSYIETKEINQVINLGDFISEGKHPKEVVDIILSDKRFINIRGYGEEQLFSVFNDFDQIGTIAWAKDKIGKERLEQIKKLPSLREINLNGKYVLLTHINGWAAITQKYAHEQDVKIETKYDYIFCGGSHLQELTHSKAPFFNKKVIMPGALALGQEQRGSFVVVDFNDEELQISFKSIKCLENHNSDSNKILKIEDLDSSETIEEQNSILLHIRGTNNKMLGNSIVEDGALENRVVKTVLKIALENSKYISIGCWDHDKNLEKEILYHLKCRVIKTSSQNGQKWFVGRVTPEIKSYLEQEIGTAISKLKWFEISFQKTLNAVTPDYSIYHHGQEWMIKNIFSSIELYKLEYLLRRANIAYEKIELDQIR